MSQAIDQTDATAVHTSGHSGSLTLTQAVEESEILLNYAAHQGIVPGEQNLQILLRSRRLQRTNNWSIEDEACFWVALNELVELVHPVTPETLIASLPAIETTEEKSERQAKQKKWQQGWRRVFYFLGFGKHKAPMSQAHEAVQRYKKFAFFSLAVLLMVQIYWVTGTRMVFDLNSLYKEVGAAQTKITDLLNARGLKYEKLATLESYDVEFKGLIEQLHFHEQKLDANYKLLKSWNSIWLSILYQEGFKRAVTEYTEIEFLLEQKQLNIQLSILQDELAADSTASPSTRLSLIEERSASSSASAQDTGAEAHLSSTTTEEILPTQKQNAATQDQTSVVSNVDSLALQQNIKEMSNEIIQAQISHEKDKAYNLFFLHFTSAHFVLEALQIYFLPLLYGLLGACTYVLRQLSVEVKQLTYSRVAEIRYGLRLALGALGGMAMSWFIKAEDTSGFASLSPMALAFLTGYNVELLFAIMDKIINTALNSLQTVEEEQIKRDGRLPAQSNATSLGYLPTNVNNLERISKEMPLTPVMQAAPAEPPPPPLVAESGSSSKATPPQKEGER